MIDLKKLVLEKKTVSIDFPEMGGFVLDLCYLGPEAIKKLRDVATVTKIDKKTRQAVSEIDDDKFAREFCNAVIKGWKGLKLKFLSELLLVDLTDQNEEEEMEYNEENAYTLFSRSNNFSMWINETVFDLSNFRK
jgi:hypothetical protein